MLSVGYSEPLLRTNKINLTTALFPYFCIQQCYISIFCGVQIENTQYHYSTSTVHHLRFGKDNFLIMVVCKFLLRCNPAHNILWIENERKLQLSLYAPNWCTYELKPKDLCIIFFLSIYNNVLNVPFINLSVQYICNPCYK